MSLDPVPVHVPPRSLRSDLRAIRIVWHRELLRFWFDKPRIIAALLQPALYLFVFGTGLSSMIAKGSSINLRVFLFPGVTAMAVLFTAFFSAGSLVWDREFGFLREMMVAPVRSSAILVGKVLGGTTTGAFQGAVVLLFGAAVGVPYSPALVAILMVEIIALSFTVTAIGLLLASRMKSIQSFMATVQMVMMPSFFLSGALFPLRGLPNWLAVVTRFDPLTYAIAPMRHAVLERAHAGAGAIADVTWSGWAVPSPLAVAIVVAAGVLALAAAVATFARTE